MTENEEIDREREWLLRQRDNGLVHDQIVALIGGSRSAVTKNLNTIDDGGNLAMPLRRKIIAYLDRQEREAAERRQAAIDEEAERRRAGAILRRRREKERIRKAKRAAARQLIDALKASLKNLEATILQALRTVNERLEKAGIDTGGRIHGDGVIYACTLEGFRYADSGAEQVAFAPPSHRFPCGLTGEELRRGISAGQRRKRFLVPAGTERPASHRSETRESRKVDSISRRSPILGRAFRPDRRVAATVSEKALLVGGARAARATDRCRCDLV